tara:strand:+ start:805 stop:2118 length:1314 start_codon:yes stop_codon:yes gene_type:complete
MIELISIFLLLLFFLLLSLFPLSLRLNKEKLYLSNNNFDVLSINLLFHTIIIFLISFTNINFKNYLYLAIIFSILFNFHYFVKFRNYFNSFKNINFIFFVIINFIIFLFLARNPILAWDGLENWYFKAQNFFYDYNFFDLKDVKGLSYYPHFGSVLWGFFWKNSMLQYEYLGRMIYVFIFLLSIFSVCELINKNSLIKIVTISLLILICFDDFLFRGYQEILIFSFFIFISKHFYYFITEEKNNNLLVCFIYLNLLPWIKHEGYLLTIIFTFSLIFMINNFSKRFEIIIFILSTWILISFKNFIFQKYIDLNLTHGAELKFLIEFEVIKDFVIAFSLGFLIALFKYKIWLIAIVSFFFISKMKKISNRQKIFFKFIKINLFLYLILVLGIYYNLSYSSIDISWWIDNSLDRLLYSISGLFIIQIVLVLDYFKNYNLK